VALRDLGGGVDAGDLLAADDTKGRWRVVEAPAAREGLVAPPSAVANAAAAIGR
jgi:hypothetical protein